jgi:hypothetical protein
MDEIPTLAMMTIHDADGFASLVMTQESGKNTLPASRFEVG